MLLFASFLTLLLLQRQKTFAWHTADGKETVEHITEIHPLLQSVIE